MGRMNAKQAWLGAMLVTGMGMGDAMAQARAWTAADYERAASMLGDRTGRLIDRAASGIGWLDDGTLVYRERTAGVDLPVAGSKRNTRSTPAVRTR